MSKEEEVLLLDQLVKEAQERMESEADQRRKARNKRKALRRQRKNSKKAK